MGLGIEIGWLATGRSASVVEVGNNVAMFDVNLHADVSRRSHSGGSAMPAVFLDIEAAFALFRRSAINLLML